jgi:hypothetical protein
MTTAFYIAAALTGAVVIVWLGLAVCVWWTDRQFARRNAVADPDWDAAADGPEVLFDLRSSSLPLDERRLM